MSFPVMVPGLASAVITVTVSVFMELCPQPLRAFTVIGPEVLLVVTLMVLVVLPPDHPDGIVHT